MGQGRAVIHFHGTPVTPRARLLELAGRHFCVSFAEPRDLEACWQIGSSLLLDNGAYSAWKGGQPVDVAGYAEWVAPLLDRRENWCVIPDEITGDATANDALIERWEELGFAREQSAPVWHLHEPLKRLDGLGEDFPRICLGSSGAYARLGSIAWHRRMREAMHTLCGPEGAPPCWLHMLRGLDLAGSEYPFASADSSNVAQNHKRNSKFGHGAAAMAQEIDARQCPPRWLGGEQLELLP
jgi:hypothetical protein